MYQIALCIPWPDWEPGCGGGMMPICFALGTTCDAFVLITYLANETMWYRLIHVKIPSKTKLCKSKHRLKIHFKLKIKYVPRICVCQSGRLPSFAVPLRLSPACAGSLVLFSIHKMKQLISTFHKNRWRFLNFCAKIIIDCQFMIKKIFGKQHGQFYRLGLGRVWEDFGDFVTTGRVGL